MLATERLVEFQRGVEEIQQQARKEKADLEEEFGKQEAQLKDTKTKLTETESERDRFASTLSQEQEQTKKLEKII